MSTWLSFFYQFTPLYGHNQILVRSWLDYGQIDENWSSVRKWLARKMPITDKMVKNGRLSVKIQTFWAQFYGQMLQKAGFVRKSPS